MEPNHTYYLVPGTISVGSLPNAPFQVPCTQNVILFVSSISFAGTLGVGVSITLNVYKNNSVTPNYSIGLAQGETVKINSSKSVDFSAGDLYHVELITVGNPSTGTFSGSLGFY